jgi:hypothetical protein
VTTRLTACDVAVSIGLADHPAVDRLREKAAQFAAAHNHGQTS